MIIFIHTTFHIYIGYIYIIYILKREREIEIEKEKEKENKLSTFNFNLNMDKDGHYSSQSTVKSASIERHDLFDPTFVSITIAIVVILLSIGINIEYCNYHSNSIIN